MQKHDLLDKAAQCITHIQHKHIL